MTVKPKGKNVYFEWTVCSPAQFSEAPSLLTYTPLAELAIIWHHTLTKLHAQDAAVQSAAICNIWGYMAPHRMDGSDHIANSWCGVKWQTGNTVHSPSAFSIHFTNVHSD